MYTDLFVHQLTHLITAMGVRFPKRVVGAGGLYLEYDGRDVPDMATVVADYDEGCQVLISATMCNDVQLPEVIRGHTATIMFDGHAEEGFRVVQQKLEGRPAPPGANTGEGGDRFKPTAAPRGHLRSLGALPRMPPLAQSRDALPGRARLRGDHHRQPGRQVIPRRQGLLLRQGDRQGLRRRRKLGQALGRGQPQTRQAHPGHGLESRRRRLAATPPRLPEAGRRLGRRQGPRRERLSQPALSPLSRRGEGGRRLPC